MEYDLILWFQATRDPAALAELWTLHERFVWQQALSRQHRCFYTSHYDLVQVGFLKFRDAVLSFDVSHGTLLSTYAYTSIKWAMDRELRCNRNIHIPAAAYATETTRAHAERASKLMLSTSRPVSSSNDDEVSRVLRELVDRESPADIVGQREAMIVLRSRLAEAIENLIPREREVIQLRLAGNTLQEVGEIIGVTRERVRQIESDAKWHLRERLADCEHLMA